MKGFLAGYYSGTAIGLVCGIGIGFALVIKKYYKAGGAN